MIQRVTIGPFLLIMKEVKKLLNQLREDQYASKMHAENTIHSRKTMIAVVQLVALGALQASPKALLRTDARSTVTDISEPAVLQSQATTTRNTSKRAIISVMLKLVLSTTHSREITTAALPRITLGANLVSLTVLLRVREDVTNPARTS